MSVSSLSRDVERLADHVEHVTEHAVAHRHRDAVAEVAHHRAAAEPVGGLEADGPHAAVADLLRDLGGDRDLGAFELGVHLDGHVDLGQAVGRELDVDDGSGDRDDAAVLQVLRTGGIGGQGHGELPFLALVSRRPRARRTIRHRGLRWCRRGGLRGAAPPRRASAPPTISMISVVIASWRARFIPRVRLVMRSSALSVADFIARCRAACSDAAALSSAAYTRAST